VHRKGKKGKEVSRILPMQAWNHGSTRGGTSQHRDALTLGCTKCKPIVVPWLGGRGDMEKSSCAQVPPRGGGGLKGKIERRILEKKNK